MLTPGGRVVVGMSGGVDSSVAALLLKRQGFDVLGVFMRNWEEEDEDGVCAATRDFEDVRAVCDIIGMPYYAVNLSKQYWDNVFERFLSEYKKGRTPNPDVLCNREIKFSAFLDFALKAGAERMATGHFVRTDGARLLRGADAAKDQSYFLYMLKAWQLERALFPVGGLTKAQVRALAAEAGLPNAKKRDSTGVCFIGERRFKAFLQQYLPMRPGVMRTPDGREVGRHDGVAFYTIGQRRGLGLGGTPVGKPWFVLDKDVEHNVLIVSQLDEYKLYKTELTASETHWVSGLPPDGARPYTARIRYRQPDQPCRVSVEAGVLRVVFDAPQRAITPGQSVVVYDGDTCLGGGIID